MKKKVVLLIVLLILLVGGFLVFLGIKNGNHLTSIFVKKNFKEYKAGDTIVINDEDWYVLRNSSSKEDYVTLIFGNIYYYVDVPYVLDEIYETSDLRKFLENDFTNEFLKDVKLVDKSGYKIRLLDMDDFNNVINYKYDSSSDTYDLGDCPFYLCLNNNVFATMIDTTGKGIGSDVKKSVSEIDDPLFDEYELHLKYYNVNSRDDKNVLESVTNDATLFIRPVINVSKEGLE